MFILRNLHLFISYPVHMCTVSCWKAKDGLRFVNTFPTIFFVHAKRFLNQSKFSGSPYWSVVDPVQSEVIE